MYNVLVVDDDKEIVKAIEIYLGKEGYHILKAYNGEEALQLIKENEIHLMILDIMMPKLNGIELATKVRKERSTPIIMLSAKSEDYDKINGLNVGADDYVTKPFNPSELVARIKSQLRRYMYLGDMKNVNKSNTINVGGLSLDMDSKQIIVDGEVVKITATEYKILKLLMSNLGKVFSAEEIYSRVWNETAFSVENTVMVHIRRIREKIEINPKTPKYLKVVWGIGYKIEKF